MRTSKIALMVLIVGAVTILLPGCASKSSSAQVSESQIATVQRGNITVAATATGNLAFSTQEDLAFNIPSKFSKVTPLTVEDVLVSEGDIVKEGQELVRLDTAEWDEQLRILEKALVTAQRALTRAEGQVTAKELAVRQAELDVKTAENNVLQIAEVKAAQDEVDNAQNMLNFAQAMLQAGAGRADNVDWAAQVTNYRDLLTKAQKNLKDVLSGSSVKVSSDVALAVAKSQLQVVQSQRALEDAQVAVENARLDKEDAEQAVKDAQRDLDETKSLSPIVKAPFAGVITKVNVKGGDEVKKGTVAVQIADPTKFKADVLVTEKDVFQVKVGGDAKVGIDALSGISLPAKVTAFAPTATISQGVVNYKVTVEIQSLQPISQTQSGSSSTAGRTAASANQSSQRPTASANQTSQRSSTTAGTAAASVPTQAISLRAGLTTTVSIIFAQKNGVLLVTNRALSRQGQATVVTVLKNGVTEKRTIKTGISDWQNTEVTEGLSEGEQVVIPKATTTTPTQQAPMFRSGGVIR